VGQFLFCQAESAHLSGFESWVVLEFQQEREKHMQWLYGVVIDRDVQCAAYNLHKAVQIHILQWHMD